MKLTLVYQAGIANVFQVQRFAMTPYLREETDRVLQCDFRTAETFCRGAMYAGAEVETMACNLAGDISDATWSKDFEAQPFNDKFRPVFSDRNQAENYRISRLQPA